MAWLLVLSGIMPEQANAGENPLAMVWQGVSQFVLKDRTG